MLTADRWLDFHSTLVDCTSYYPIKVFDLRKLKAYCKKTNLNINSAIVSTNTTKDVRLYLNMIGFSFSIFNPGIIDEWNLEMYFDILG